MDAATSPGAGRCILEWDVLTPILYVSGLYHDSCHIMDIHGGQ
jgi:hypothetical protein